MDRFKTDLANLLDQLTDIIEKSDVIYSKEQCVYFLRQMADYARNYKGVKGEQNGIHET